MTRDSTIEVRAEQVSVLINHHSDISHFNVVLNGIRFSIVDATSWV